MAAPVGGGARDTPNLEYKLHRKFKVFNTSIFRQQGDDKYNLVASSPKHGVVFVASTDKLLAVYRVAELLYSKAEPSRVTVKLPEEPLLIAVNCDEELLAVGGHDKSILIYNVKDLLNQDASPKLSVPRGSSCGVIDMQWSPSMNETLAIGFYDKLTILHVGTGKRNDVTSNIWLRCLSWRPSGSSLVVGCRDGGTLRVYSPDLSLEKRIPVPAPPLFGEAAVWVDTVHWMSNNQFAVVYHNINTQGRQSAYTLINAPEEEPPRAEIVGRLKSRSDGPRYRLLQIKPWNVMLCTALKAGCKLLPPASDGGGSQAPVQLVSELLRDDDMYAVGVALDRGPVLRLSSQSHIPEPEDDGIAHVTLVHVLTQVGDLATYIVSERAPTPSVAEKEAAECAAPVAAHEGGAAQCLVETALARMRSLILAADPLPTPVQAAGRYWCSLCALEVPRGARLAHERGRRHGACAALAHAALRRAGPPPGARVPDRRLLTLLRLYCGDQARPDHAEPTEPDHTRIHNVD